jgi:hypothetical protein
MLARSARTKSTRVDMFLFSCRVCHGANGKIAHTGCACKHDLVFAHVSCQARACVGEASPHLGGQWSLTCKFCKQRFTGEMRRGLVDLRWAQVCARANADPERMEVQTELVKCLCEEGEHAQAERVCRCLLKAQAAQLGTGHMSTMSTMNNLAICFAMQGKHAHAVLVLQRLLRVIKSSDDAKPRALLMVQKNLASCMSLHGQPGEAEHIQRHVLDAEARLLGPKHMETLKTASDLTTSLLLQHKNDEAAELAQKTVDARVEMLGAEHATTAISTAKLAAAKSNLGRLLEAEHLLVEVLKVRRRVLPPGHRAIVHAGLQLARCMKKQKRHAAARGVLQSIGCVAERAHRVKSAATARRCKSGA